MIGWLKKRLRRFTRSCLAEELRAFEKNRGGSPHRDPRTSASVQIAQRFLFNHWQSLKRNGALPQLGDTGFRVFSQFEKDGMILFLFAVLGAENCTFVDVGAGDGINSNCANLALNFGWRGLFIDGNEESIERGRAYYERHPSTWAYPPEFVHAMVQRENVNEIIKTAGFEGPIDLLSIDIDGNDYWIWDALDCVSPNVVIIETHVEFGFRSIVVPYDKDYVYPGKHKQYHGASPVAMAKLAKRKGYRLVGANNYGFNTIYVRNGLGDELIPEVSVESILQHPRNAERFQLFEDVKDWDYVEV